MSFIPQESVDPDAVMGSLRVALQNNVHSGEQAMHVALDTIGNLMHETATLANAGLLSTIELQQALLRARSGHDFWTCFAEHGGRLNDHYMKFLKDFIATRHAAMQKLLAEDGDALD